MAHSPVVITLTPAQRALIRKASGKSVVELSIEPVETGSGWLCSAGGKKFRLLEHPDPESYGGARQNAQSRIVPRQAKFRLKIWKSPIHRWGVFAAEQIPARRNVIEYVRELVNPVEAYGRVKNVVEASAFKLDEFRSVDGAIGGAGGQFINHGCDPNLRWRRLGERILCQSVRPIAVGEELTLDYNLPANSPKVPCRCGSPKCRGTINVLKDAASTARIRKGRALSARQ